MFPQVDPIPLPAPVWLFKFLHGLTLTLHFAAVYILVGGLAMVCLWAILGRRSRNQAMLDAAGAVSHRLPVVMTYVINLGVPPLLFTQVLYGRAIYSSSVLIGVWWISVIVMLTAAYACLYAINTRAREGRPYGWIGLISLFLIVSIGKIYTMNMTLMLRPDVWLEMYRTDALGASLPPSDPTVMPRWLFMMVGSLAGAGLFMWFIGQKKFLTEEAALFLRTWGGRLTALGVLAQGPIALWAYKAQPALVQESVMSGTLTKAMAFAYLGTATVLLVLGGVGAAKAASRSWLLPSLASLVAVVNVAAVVIVRDGMRDAALLAHQYDVWNREVVTNWSVVGIFLGLLVIGIGVLGWLSMVLAKAEGMQETYA